MKFALILPALLGVCLVTSCDKVSDLTEKVSGLWSDDPDTASAEVLVVGEEEGKSIIAKESRLVMVEFYSDT